MCCFADDLAAAAYRIRCSFPALMACFDNVRLAARLKVNVKKTSLVYYGTDNYATVAGELAEIAWGDRMEVSGRGVYLGVPVGPSAGRGFWDKLTVKIRSVIRHIGGLHITLFDRARACKVYGQSVASYLSQIRRPDASLVRADRAALAMLLSAPMHSLGPGLMPHIGGFGRSASYL